MVDVSRGVISRDWEDPGVVKRNNRRAHSPLHCHATIQGALDFWQKRNSADKRIAEQAIWGDDALEEALKSAASWVDGLPFVVSLSGYWKFHLAGQPENVPPSFQSPSFDDSEWSVLPGRRIFLSFEAVDSAFYVWVNGMLVGYSQDSRLPADFEITELCHEPPSKKENLIAVQVMRWSDGSYLEDQDHWWLSGIHRNVLLYSKPKFMIADYFVKTCVAEDSSVASLEVEMLLEIPHEEGSHISIPKGVVEGVLFESKDGVMVEAARLSSKSDTELAIGSCIRKSIEGKISAPKLWSAEQPNLYTLVILLKDASNEYIDVEACQVGVRTIALSYKELLINNKPIIITGVNRHEHHPRLGKTNIESCIIKDIVLMKQNNINAVRNSHYPQHPRWYELCDLFGLYLIDEANIETHGFDPLANPNSREQLTWDINWANAMLQRAINMVERDKNHACIIVWSLGNESGYGPNHGALSGWIRGRDSTRPLHYEGGGSRTVSTDIVCPMYMRVWDIIKVAMDKTETRPLILCEYSHAMGNSNGSIHEYWEAIDEIHGLQGGFIWDWVDQGLLKEASDGKKHWAYGGDFGDSPNDLNFCLNGLIWPDRSPHPALHEVKYLYQPIKMHLRQNTVEITNRNFFTSTADLAFLWQFFENGVSIGSGELQLPELQPGQKHTLSLQGGPWSSCPTSSHGSCTSLTMVVKQKTSTRWCDAGHVIASSQFIISEGFPLEAKVDDGMQLPTVLLKESNETVSVKAANHDWIVEFDKRDGMVKSWKVNNAVVFESGPKPCFYRAPTDNDRGGGNASHAFRWNESGLDSLIISDADFHAKQVSDSVVEASASLVIQSTIGQPEIFKSNLDAWQISEETSRPNIVVNNDPSKTVVAEVLPSADKIKQDSFHVLIKYKIRGDGRMIINFDIKPQGQLPPLPRIGIVFMLPKEFNQVLWYGRGPFECYPDRKQAAHVSVYEAGVADLHVPYIYPGECGGRADVTWVLFKSTTRHVGLLASTSQGNPPMQMSASYFTTEDLDKATHEEELHRNERIEVHLDHKHMGLGGDDSWSPTVHEKYLVQPVPCTFSLSFEPVTSDVELSKKGTLPDWL